MNTKEAIRDNIDELIAEGRLEEAYTCWKANIEKYYASADDVPTFTQWAEKTQKLKDRNLDITIPKLSRSSIIDDSIINDIAEKGRQYYLEKRKLELEVKQLAPSFWKTFERVSLWFFALGGLIIAIIAIIISLK